MHFVNRRPFLCVKALRCLLWQVWYCFVAPCFVQFHSSVATLQRWNGKAPSRRIYILMRSMPLSLNRLLSMSLYSHSRAWGWNHISICIYISHRPFNRDKGHGMHLHYVCRYFLTYSLMENTLSIYNIIWYNCPTQHMARPILPCHVRPNGRWPVYPNGIW